MKALVTQPPDPNVGDARQPVAPTDTSVRGRAHRTKGVTRFDASALSSCDEPVRRYFTHAIAHGASLEPRMRLRMKGRIKVGLWLPFTADQDCDGSSFVWRAEVPRYLPFLTVTDSYDSGRGTIDGRLLGVVRMFHSDDQNIVRSAAARAATEGILAPIGLLPTSTRIWHAESDTEIVVDLALAPERPALHLTIDNDGAVQSVNLQRWSDAADKAFGYLPFGGDILAEKRFGDLVLPSRLQVGWWHGTERFAPFFEAEIISAVSNSDPQPDQVNRNTEPTVSGLHFGGPRGEVVETVNARTTKPRELLAQLRDVASDLPAFLTAPLYRRWHLQWGATSAEVGGSLPGDAILTHAQFKATRAITINAPPNAVWPWLVQVGCLRAGWYSNDLLDNLGHPSATTIVPTLQHLQIGQWVPMSPTSSPTERTALKVHSFEINKWLLWTKPDSTWAWQLTPTDEGGTRLVTRIHAVYDWRHPLMAVLGVLLMEFGDFAMIRRMLRGIKARAESLTRGLGQPRAALPKVIRRKR
jgi:hypothetical protein